MAKEKKPPLAITLIEKKLGLRPASKLKGGLIWFDGRYKVTVERSGDSITVLLSDRDGAQSDEVTVATIAFTVEGKKVKSQGITYFG